MLPFSMCCRITDSPLTTAARFSPTLRIRRTSILSAYASINRCRSSAASLFHFFLPYSCLPLFTCPTICRA